MEQIENDSFESSLSTTYDQETKPDDLLEENWFFGNLLDKKTKKTMSRCYSDLCSSSRENEKFLEKKKNLKKAPSLPISMGRQKQDEERDLHSGKMSNKNSIRKPSSSLHRAPSLPSFIGKEEDVENEFSLSRLIRQASLSSSDDQLPLKHNSKGINQCPNAPRGHPQMKPVLESIVTEGSNLKRTQSLKVPSKLRKSVSDYKLDQDQGLLMDMGSKFDKKYLDPIEIPLARGKTRMGFNENKARSYCQPSGPNWQGKSSSSDDMKAQIKYWARAVAANVR